MSCVLNIFLILTGVKARNSDNGFMKEKLGWEPDCPLRNGMEKTYAWIKNKC